LAGNAILAASVTFLIVPNEILTGGVAGLSIALYPIVHIPAAVMINILTIGLFFVGWIFLGKTFAGKTVLSAVSYPIFISLFTYFSKDMDFVMQPWIASVYGGLLAGAGLGLAFRAGASTGGMDIPALILAKYTPLKEGEAVMVVDGFTVALGMMTYGLEPALVGLLSVFVSGFVINKVILSGTASSQSVMVISDQWEAIRDAVYHTVDRGVTLLDAKGGWTGRNVPVVMCVINSRQFPVLEKGILDVDPNAFIIVSDVHSVRGEGFSPIHSVI
jgi:uncharacterized membrane-anchored protein YitT (DUF2179 family)